MPLLCTFCIPLFDEGSCILLTTGLVLRRRWASGEWPCSVSLVRHPLRAYGPDACYSTPYVQMQTHLRC